MSNLPTDQPHSLLHGHLQYAKGAVETVIGHVTGNESWAESGEQDKRAAHNEMLAADSMDAPTRASRYQHISEPSAGKYLKAEGEAERLLGKAMHCPGLEKIGEEKKTVGDEKEHPSESSHPADK